MCCSAIAQETRADYFRPFSVGQDGGIDGKDCEKTKAALDLSFHDARDVGTITIISWLGRGEASGSLSRRRLRNLREYLHTTRAVKDERIETSEGGRTPGLGKVEIYAEGRPRLLFYLKRNRDFWKGCGVKRKAQSNNSFNRSAKSIAFIRETP